MDIHNGRVVYNVSHARQFVILRFIAPTLISKSEVRSTEPPNVQRNYSV